MRNMGRTSSYTLKMAQAICEEIATTDHGISNICARSDRPDLKTVYKWLDEQPVFLQLYTRARDLQADYMACQIREIADTQEPGVIERTDKDGNVLVETRDMIEHRRLRIDARKWLMAKLAPRKYGERLELSGQVDLTMSPAETLRQRRLERLGKIEIPPALPAPEE